MAATICRLTVCAKAEREGLMPADPRTRARLVETIKRERRR